MNKKQFTPAEHKEIIVGPSEHGGASTVIFYFNSNYKPIEKSQATRAIAHEYDEKGRSMHREYLVLREGVIIPSQDLSDQDFSDGFEDKIVVPRRKTCTNNKNSQNQKRSTSNNQHQQRSRTNQQRKPAKNQASRPQSEGTTVNKKRSNRPNPHTQPAAKKKTAAPVATGARASDIPNRPKRSRARNTGTNRRPKPTEAP